MLEIISRNNQNLKSNFKSTSPFLIFLSWSSSSKLFIFLYYSSTILIITNLLASTTTNYKLVSNNHQLINSLKSSLSNVLTKYYPLVGSIQNNYIECNDKGVIFSEAKVSCQLLEIINELELPSEFKKFIPFDQEKDGIAAVNDLAIAIQINLVNCGSITIVRTINQPSVKTIIEI